MNREPSQLLQGVQHLALTTDELRQVAAAVDTDNRTVTLDIQIDIAIEVQEVQQLLQVIAGDFALGNQTLLKVGRTRLSLRRGGLLGRGLFGLCVQIGHRSSPSVTPVQNRGRLALAATIGPRTRLRGTARRA
ncbi:Uncharacterised protein [Mycobacteroides abscessus subsp. abscessus]|nr:Uncharacterised protein [Mycobacteroides abscessus subsp. abscessus]